MTDAPLPEIGQIVAVRQRLYLVDHVIPPPSPADSLLVRLSCVDDDAQGQPLDVLWDRELDAQVITGEAWEAIARRGFDPADRFAAYLNTLRWNCVTSTDPNLLQSPSAPAHAEVNCYPLVKFCLMEPCQGGHDVT
jgi:hypothetical protein